MPLTLNISKFIETFCFATFLARLAEKLKGECWYVDLAAMKLVSEDKLEWTKLAPDRSTKYLLCCFFCSLPKCRTIIGPTSILNRRILSKFS